MPEDIVNEVLYWFQISKNGTLNFQEFKNLEKKREEEKRREKKGD